MGCGNICADCSWEEHLESMAHTGPYEFPIHEATPNCCRASAEAHELAVEIWENNHPEDYR